MFDKLINSRNEFLYGVPSPSPNRGLQYFLFFLFFALIPLILIIGILVFAKRRQLPRKVKILTVTIAMIIYYGVVIGAIFMAVYIFR